MAKTYIDTVKYVVHANLEIGGMVEKPDVVGALFGQTEGLLGDDLDLRELQKNGRIGRIEVELQPRAGKSLGKIQLPSSLDMVETSILAAALETVDRVGPYNASIQVQKIEDTRNVKRRAVVDRAKVLLKSLLTTEIPESSEISEMVRKEVKISEIVEYGPDRLPAGPGVKNADSIIIVEGRADVLNLLKNSMDNAVAIGGANVPKSIVGICRQKEVTMFLDGDRGGDIILREITSVADVDFVARAPAGKEVEELTRKELIKALRGRVPVEQAENNAARQENDNRGRYRRREPRYSRDSRSDRRSAPVQQVTRSAPRTVAPRAAPRPVSAPREAPKPVAQAAPAVPNELHSSLTELENTARARLYGAGNSLKSEILVKDILPSLESVPDIHAVVFDGVVTQRLVDLAAKKGVKILLGIKVGNVFNRPPGINIGEKK